MEQVVVGGAAAPRRVDLRPGGAVGPDPLDPHGLRPAPPQQRFQLGQRRGELHRGDELQLLPVEDPQEHLEHVFAHRVLGAGEKHARVVARGGLRDGAGIDRAAVGPYREHQPVVADMLQVLGQARAPFVEGHPVVDAQLSGGPQGLGGGEVLGKQGAVEVAGQEACGPRAVGGERPRQVLPTGQHADLAEDGRRPLAPVGDQHHGGLGPRPEDEPVAQPLGRRSQAGHLLRLVDPGIEAHRGHRPGRIRLDHADEERLGDVAGIVHLEHVRLAGPLDGQRVRFPACLAGAVAGGQLGQRPQGVLPSAETPAGQRLLSQARPARNRRQVGELGPPLGIGRVDLLNHAQARLGALAERRRAGLEHQHLDRSLGQRRLQPQLGADRLGQGHLGRPGRRDQHVVSPFRHGQRHLDRQRGGLARRDGELFGTQLLAAAGTDQLHLDPQLAAGLGGQQMRLEVESKRLAGGKHQPTARQPDPQLVSRGAARHEAVAAIVELGAGGAVHQVGQADFDPRRRPLVVGGRQLDPQRGLGRGGHQQIDRVVRARRALANHQMAVGEVGRGAGLRAIAARSGDFRLARRQPHRAHLVGLDAQRDRLGQEPFADGDLALPEPLGPAAPGEPKTHGLRCTARG